MKSMLIILIALCLLAGCATKWSRPNTTEQEFYQDRFQCEQDAASMYPVAMSQTSYGNGYQAPTQTNCQTYGNNTNCSTTPGVFIPPVKTVQDANGLNRAMAIRSCLQS